MGYVARSTLTTRVSHSVQLIARVVVASRKEGRREEDSDVEEEKKKEHLGRILLHNQNGILVPANKYIHKMFLHIFIDEIFLLFKELRRLG